MGLGKQSASVARAPGQSRPSFNGPNKAAVVLTGAGYGLH